MNTNISENREDILILLNASEGLLQVGLAEGHQVVAWREFEAAGQGAETLIPTLADMLHTAGYKRTQISRIACVRGPGSFTGIRLALTTAFGLSRAIIRPDGETPRLAGIDYLPLLAASALPQARKKSPENLAALWVLTHARRGQVNAQAFGLDAAPLSEPETVSLIEAVSRIAVFSAAHTGAVALLGSGATRNREELSRALPQMLFLPEKYSHPSPAALLHLAEQAVYSHEPVVPFYLRPCDAEENLPGIAAGLGLDPQEAAEALKRLQSRICIC